MLDKLARWFTRDPESTFKAWYDKLTEKEAKGDASLLAPVLKMQIPLLIQKYPVFVFLYVFFKLTFTKIRFKVVDPNTMKTVTEEKPKEKTNGGAKPTGQPSPEDGQTS